MPSNRLTALNNGLTSIKVVTSCHSIMDHGNSSYICWVLAIHCKVWTKNDESNHRCRHCAISYDTTQRGSKNAIDNCNTSMTVKKRLIGNGTGTMKPFRAMENESYHSRWSYSAPWYIRHVTLYWLQILVAPTADAHINMVYFDTQPCSYIMMADLNASYIMHEVNAAWSTEHNSLHRMRMNRKHQTPLHSWVNL